MQKHVFVNKFLAQISIRLKKRPHCSVSTDKISLKIELCLNKNGYPAAILMGLSKTFDTINHKLHIAKSNTSEFF